MDESKRMEQEKSVLRWGGLAGLLGGILFIIVFVIVGVFVGDPAGQSGFLDQGGALGREWPLPVHFILWVPHFLALFQALRSTSLAPALFGSTLGILGIGVLAAGALPHVATVPLSDLYHESGAAPDDQAALALIWQATWGVFDALLFTGLGIVAAGLTMLGAAMLNAPMFGKGFGWLSVIFGLLGIVATIGLLIDPASPIAVLAVFSLILFHLVIGWKVFRLSQAS